MTRDEILKLEAGRELDALVAEKVMGWKYSDYWNQLAPPEQPEAELWSDWQMDTDGVMVRKPINMLPGVTYAGDKPYIKHYSSDIAAAWEVVEKLGLSIVDTGSCDPDTRYMAGGFSGMSNFYGYIEGHIGYDNDTGFAPTAPLAICRAALLTVEAE